MTTTNQPADTFRRATEAEIATVQAWVADHTADWADDDDLDQARQDEYQHALEILIFANGGRDSSRPSWAGDVERLRCGTCRLCASPVNPA